MIIGCRFPTAAFSFSKRFKTEMNKGLVDIKKIEYLFFNAKGDNKVKIIGAGEAVSGRGKKSVGVLS